MSRPADSPVREASALERLLEAEARLEATLIAAREEAAQIVAEARVWAAQRADITGEVERQALALDETLRATYERERMAFDQRAGEWIARLSRLDRARRTDAVERVVARVIASARVEDG